MPCMACLKVFFCFCECFQQWPPQIVQTVDCYTTWLYTMQHHGLTEACCYADQRSSDCKRCSNCCPPNTRLCTCICQVSHGTNCDWPLIVLVQLLFLFASIPIRSPVAIWEDLWSVEAEDNKTVHEWGSMYITKMKYVHTRVYMWACLTDLCCFSVAYPVFTEVTQQKFNRCLLVSTL